MTNETYILNALEDIRHHGYSLVLSTGRWVFAKGPRLFPENPSIDEPLIKAGDILRMGHWATPLAALVEYGKRVTPRSIRSAPTGSPGIVKITKEQFEAIKKIVIAEAANNKPTTAGHILALEAMQSMSYCFGASSTDFITLYPSVG